MQLQNDVLVTRGAGFIGGILCDRLVALGHEVLCVVNFYTSSRQDLEHLIDHLRVELVRQDVTFPLYVELDEFRNLACPVSAFHSKRDPMQTTKTSMYVV
jgi:UDP-glucuronate decarboxylase